MLAIMILLFVLSGLFAANQEAMFYIRWTNKTPESTSFTFTDFSDTASQISSKEIQLTGEVQNAFSTVYSTNRLGTHNIRFTSTRLTNGTDSIPFSIQFLSGGEEFCSLNVGSSLDQYVSSTGKIMITRATLAASTPYVTAIQAKLSLDIQESELDTIPTGNYAAQIQFIVEVQ